MFKYELMILFKTAKTKKTNIFRNFYLYLSQKTLFS